MVAGIPKVAVPSSPLIVAFEPSALLEIPNTPLLAQVVAVAAFPEQVVAVVAESAVSACPAESALPFKVALIVEGNFNVKLAEPLTFWSNYSKLRYSIFGHTHFRLNPLRKQLFNNSYNFIFKS